MKKNNKQEKNAAALSGVLAVSGAGSYALGRSTEKDFMKLVKKPEDAKAIADKLGKAKSMKRWGAGMAIASTLPAGYAYYEHKKNKKK